MCSVLLKHTSVGDGAFGLQAWTGRGVAVWGGDGKRGARVAWLTSRYGVGFLEPRVPSTSFSMIADQLCRSGALLVCSEENAEFWKSPEPQKKLRDHIVWL